MSPVYTGGERGGVGAWGKEEHRRPGLDLGNQCQSIRGGGPAKQLLLGGGHRRGRLVGPERVELFEPAVEEGRRVEGF